VPSWVPKADGVPAIFHAGYAAGQYWHNGRVYADETAFNVAVSGSVSGATRRIGPVDVDGAPELISNGDFTVDASGWTSTPSAGVDLAAVGGQLEHTLNGITNGGALQNVSAILGRAYTTRGKLRRGTNTNNLFFLTNKSSGFAGGPSVAALTQMQGFWGAEGGMAVVTRAGATTPTGTYYADDISVKEVRPFPGYVPEFFGATIVGITPASTPVSEQVLFDAQSDGYYLYNGAWIEAATTRNCIRVVQDTSGRIKVTVRFGGSDAAVLDLGAVPGATQFRVDLACKTNRFVAWLNGGVAVADVVGTMPGIAYFRIGRSPGGEAWGGSVVSVSVYGHQRSPGNAIRFEGDSYAGGAGGVSLPTTLQTLMSRPVINTGVGASEMSGIRDRVLLAADADLLPCTTVIWDGSQNGYTTASAYTDLLATAIAKLGHNRFIVIPAAVPYNLGPYAGSQAEAIANEYQSRWPNNFLHWRDWIANTNGVINQDRMLNYPSDAWHLNQTAMNEMAAGISAFITAKGW
jgi:hypothetical protein